MSGTQLEALDFKYLLLEYYKKFKITENELSVILMIDHLLSQKNTFITPDLLSMKMNLSTKELDDIFVSLIERGFLLFDTGKNLKVSLKPLAKQLFDKFEQELVKESKIKASEEKTNTLKTLHKTFEEQLGRKLSPLETSLINDWVDHGYKPTTIVDALKECLSTGNKTFKAIDKLLKEWQNRDDFDKAGFTNASDKWDKDIEKTMEIAKAKWIDD